MRFSERYGHTPIRETIQIESIDERLRNGLWSLLNIHCWNHVYPGHHGIYLNHPVNKEIRALCTRLWLDYFKNPVDLLSNHWHRVFRELRDYFFSCQWYEVYDFIEFVAANYNRRQFKELFIRACNDLLQREMSAYRFVSGVIARITEEQELAEIEQAIEGSSEPVSEHLRRSLELLSDRNEPDYRNSVKESISAVESVVTIILKADKATLPQLLKKLEDEIRLHPALKTALSKLYGYTSDEGGIRHALTDAQRVDFNDAKFMLVVWSVFVNFVRGKMQNGGRPA